MQVKWLRWLQVGHVSINWLISLDIPGQNRYVLGINAHVTSVKSLLHLVSQRCIKSLLICSSIFIRFCRKQLWLAKENHVICFSQSQLLHAETNEDWNKTLKALLRCVDLSIWCHFLWSFRLCMESRDLIKDEYFIFHSPSFRNSVFSHSQSHIWFRGLLYS